MQDCNPCGGGDSEKKPKRYDKGSDAVLGPERNRRYDFPLREHFPGAFKIAPERTRFENEVNGDHSGDVIQHERGDDFVRAQIGTKKTWNRSPQGTAECACDDHRRNSDPYLCIATQCESNTRGKDCSDVELALAADIEKSDTKRNGCAKSGEEQRRRSNQGSTERTSVEKGSFKDPLIHGNRVLAGHQKEQSASKQRSEERSNRYRPIDEAR